MRRKRTTQQPNSFSGYDDKFKAGEAKIREYLAAEAETSWKTAEAITAQRDLILTQVKANHKNPEYGKEMKQACGFTTLNKYWFEQFDLKPAQANRLMHALRLYKVLAPPAHIKMSPSGMTLGLSGIKTDEEQLDVLREAVKNAPEDGRVGVKTIGKAAKAYLQEHSPERPQKDELRELTKSLASGQAKMRKFCAHLAVKPDRAAIIGAYFVLDGLADHERELMTYLRGLMDDVARAEVDAEIAKVKRERQAAAAEEMRNAAKAHKRKKAA